VPTVVGGRLLLVGNVEMRFPVPYFSRYRFSAAVFADGGNVWQSLGSVDLEDFRLTAHRNEVTEEDFRYSVGVGIRVQHARGPHQAGLRYSHKSGTRRTSSAVSI